MVKGVAALHARFQKVPEIVKQEVRLQLEKEATTMVREMRSLARKGATRRLVNSIGWTWGDAPEGSITIGSFRGSATARIRITIYAGGGDAFYARFHEFGTVKMAASPFFYPVIRSNKRRVRAALSRAVRRGFQKA